MGLEQVTMPERCKLYDYNDDDDDDDDDVNIQYIGRALFWGEGVFAAEF
jgi:hypothetical protein